MGIHKQKEREREKESQLQGQVKEEARVLYIVRPLHFLKDKKLTARIT